MAPPTTRRRMILGVTRGLALALVLLLATAATGQDDAGTVSAVLPGHGALSVTVPAGWRTVARETQEAPPAALFRFAPPEGDAFALEMTGIWLEKGPPTDSDAAPARMKAMVARLALGPLATAEEKEAVIETLRGAQAVGYFFTLTDRAPALGEYRYLTQGLVVAGPSLTTFTLLHRAKDGPERAAALRMLAALSYTE